MTKKELGFPAVIGREGKITIPHEIRKLLDLKKGDTIYVTEIRKLKSEELKTGGIYPCQQPTPSSHLLFLL